MEYDDVPRRRRDAAHELAQEDLAPYSQDELAIRISLLKAEIDRVRDHNARAQSHRAAADALFGKKADLDQDQAG